MPPSVTIWKKKIPSEIVIEHISTKMNKIINFICTGKVDWRALNWWRAWKAITMPASQPVLFQLVMYFYTCVFWEVLNYIWILTTKEIHIASRIPTLDGETWELSRLVNSNREFHCLLPGELFLYKEIHQINPISLIGCVITAHHTNWLHVSLLETIWLILCVCVQIAFQVVTCACSAWAAECAFLTAWPSLNSK